MTFEFGKVGSHSCIVTTKLSIGIWLHYFDDKNIHFIEQVENIKYAEIHVNLISLDV